MKRDMDLIRSILLGVEEDKWGYGQLIALDGVDGKVIGHHVALILDAGLAVGTLRRVDAFGIVGGSIERLTSSGHDFCEGIRQDTIWNKAKEHIIKPGASYGLSILVEWVKIEVHKHVFGN
jgi:hypothetical protein